MCKCIHPSFSAYLPRMEGMVYSQDAGQHERNGTRHCTAVRGLNLAYSS